MQQSRIKLGCTFENEYFIKENDCHFIIGRIQHIYVDREIQAEDGWLNLERAQTVCIDGLDGYALPQILNRFTYAQPDQPVNSIKEFVPFVKSHSHGAKSGRRIGMMLNTAVNAAEELKTYE